MPKYASFHLWGIDSLGRVQWHQPQTQSAKVPFVWLYLLRGVSSRIDEFVHTMRDRKQAHWVSTIIHFVCVRARVCGYTAFHYMHAEVEEEEVPTVLIWEASFFILPLRRLGWMSYYIIFIPTVSLATLLYIISVLPESITSGTSKICPRSF